MPEDALLLKERICTCLHTTTHPDTASLIAKPRHPYETGISPSSQPSGAHATNDEGGVSGPEPVSTRSGDEQWDASDEVFSILSDVEAGSAQPSNDGSVALQRVVNGK